MGNVRLFVDGIEIEAREDATVLEAARDSGIYIPNLCADPDLEPYGACRLCIVEIDGQADLPVSCMTPVAEGMVVHTDTPRVNEVRRRTVELLLSDHPENCLLCAKNQRCELQKIAAYLGVDRQRFKPLNRPPLIDSSNPFFIRNSGKCILCGKCVRVCNEIQGLGALMLSNNGASSKIITADDKPMFQSVCESCGQCVAKCPTGALTVKNFTWPDKEVKTICPYCGVGCGIYLAARGNSVVGVFGDPDNPVNKGSLCVKGQFGVEFINHSDRLTSPLISKNGSFSEASWDEALDLIATKLSKYKGEEVAVISSAKCTNEENYLIQKFARVVLGTHNVDHCARLCHASTVAGLAASFGSGAMTNSIGEISGAASILAIGTNTTETHPVIGIKVRKAAEDGAKLIVANPREIDLCRIAHVRLRHRPGSDVALLMGMMRVIFEENLHDPTFIAERCENFDAFRQSLESFDLDFVEEKTTVPRDLIVEAARLYATKKPAAILYAMGITQHTHGTDNVLAIANLAMLTGNIGKPSTGVNPLRGQNNVQGACDMGALPNMYTGYQRVDDPKVRKKFEKAWGVGLNPSPGLTLTEIFEAAYEGKIKAIYLVGENPVLSDPDAKHVEEALRRLEFFVVQDIFLSETARIAHVVLPAATFAEKDGTVTNTERRVQRMRKVIEPIGNSQPDWWLTSQLGRRMGGKGFDFDHPSEIMEEIAGLTPSYGGITYPRLEKGGLQWPCTSEDHPGTPILHVEGFLRGKGRFAPLAYRPPTELPDDEYPFMLTTERGLYQYHTGTMTRKVAGLDVLHGEELLEINPEDAKTLGVADGEKVKVTSRRGAVTVRAKVTPISPRGVFCMSFHFAESPTNILTNPALDPVAKIPELKVCAVKAEKVASSGQ
ncbi:MAG: formate dehydrogenase subunit alpha [Deltaproteobacteria bacterium]|nr:formate dehydrogenase subunit alpha [Deltaproteobacteria bacterium]MBW2151219.1 formate dehydrogenase subunit alpha [Deltaproteobacteria bacterium]